MNMQDKELDELFRSKLEDFESVPATDVWNKIAGELNGTPRKRAIAPFMRVAASVLLLLSAGLFFYKQQHIVPLSAVKSHSTAQLSAQTKENIATTTKPAETHPDDKRATIAQPVLASGAQLALTSTPKIKAAVQNAHDNKQLPAPDRENKQKDDTQPETLTAMAKLKIDVSKPVVPDMKLSAVTPADLPPAPVANNNNNTAVIAQNITKPSKKHGIRSFGDMVNAVVAKVDKRADKVIEFSDADDEESNITGLNLGLLKVKKEK